MTDEEPSELRASDADRERVAEQLRDAVAEGRLDMEEFEERLEATYKARTYGELTPITRDLPAAGVGAPPVSMVKQPAPSGSWAERIVGGDGSSSWAVAIMAGFQRKGRWTVPKRFNSFAFWGGGEIDLREAYFADREVVVNCVAIMGGMNVVVPPGVEVVVRGIGVMGGFDHREEGVPGEPGAPRVIVTGFAFWGGVGVERKLTRAERLRLKEQRRQEKLERRAARKELQGSGSDGRDVRDTLDELDDVYDTAREALEEHRDLVRERHEERRERHAQRHELHRERREARREDRDRRRHRD
ncbi:hypothetical protein AQJ43_25390 [Streptomyces avermitilis]|uniref:DUF1707 domain-containing protein n=2 Tax=Streptomyces avermitilis TaxID=33903 RepID=Q82D05_STRAW|nr:MULTISPECIES: DUF1707 domain-containing protein [Streptomyces]KUN51772.1 hypothetical protein AQJ43_25390 [Streptomyces avermitilis]MYT00770.1 DUF1707 domain-containing protein [Streptomyces sp. SID5469]OOV30426.1 hypothetical protein SM007_14295 [Streptomyces avermitilis]BAC72895.1 hypothetical protein SAVERM_5183 [Streptomyces avermitilis MA-4680 = NBRC 14893]BBJ53298.1 hypothetical protein SAVMC3_59270 [Streptomyces avermitilis]